MILGNSLYPGEGSLARRSSGYKKGNPHQEWQLADVGYGQYLIINNGTGTLLAASNG